MDWKQTLSIFIGTSPLLFVLVWSLIDIRSFKAEVKAEFLLVRKDLNDIKGNISSVKERLATRTFTDN